MARKNVPIPMVNEKKLVHLGIIMDGNRRWAKKLGLSPLEGHRTGYEKAKKVLEWCRAAGIKILTLYAFSIENWQRPEKEVNFLMSFLHYFLTNDIKKLHENNVRVKIIGRKDGLPEKLQAAIQEAEELTKNNTGPTVNIAINYGGRQEIVDAVNKILKSLPCGEKITEKMISENIYTAGLPEPDLIIRTSGEIRLSGFLMWQSVYSELCFTKQNWPDFSRFDFHGALEEFSRRQRRFGK